ncbi:MAG: hypothetical protein Q9222_002229 [Ikaeria aurantiellina]
MVKWTDEMDRAALLCMLFAHHGGSPKISQNMIEQLGHDLAKYGVSGNGARQRLQAFFKDYKPDGNGETNSTPDAATTSAPSTSKKRSPRKRKGSGTPDVKPASNKRIKVEVEEGSDGDSGGNQTGNGITDGVEDIKDHGVPTEQS